MAVGFFVFSRLAEVNEDALTNQQGGSVVDLEGSDDQADTDQTPTGVASEPSDVRSVRDEAPRTRIKIDPAVWTAESTDQTDPHEVNEEYAHTDGTITLYARTEDPSFLTSPASGVTCKYENGAWAEYTREGEQSRTNDCVGVEPEIVHDIEVHYLATGAFDYYQPFSLFSFESIWYKVVGEVLRSEGPNSSDAVVAEEDRQRNELDARIRSITEGLIVAE